MSELSPKQKRFCQEYMKDLNGTQAAIRAGYSKKTAKEIAAQNLSKLNIQEFIQKLQDKIKERNNITVDKLISELVNIYDINPADIYDKKGNLKPIQDLPENITRAIREIEVVERYSGKSIQIQTRKIKFHNKLEAIEKLARHIGFYEKDNEQKKIELPIPITIKRETE